MMNPPSSTLTMQTPNGRHGAGGVLSPRELDVLRLVSEGRRDREIAERLYLSHHTVANHVRNILAKLDVQSRAAAVAHAARNGLI